MKELDFEIYIYNDAGKTFYRGLIIYGFTYTFTKMQLTKDKQSLIKMIQRDFWRPNHCFIQMKHK